MLIRESFYKIFDIFCKIASISFHNTIIKFDIFSKYFREVPIPYLESVKILSR